MQYQQPCRQHIGWGRRWWLRDVHDNLCSLICFLSFEERFSYLLVCILLLYEGIHFISNSLPHVINSYIASFSGLMPSFSIIQLFFYRLP